MTIREGYYSEQIRNKSFEEIQSILGLMQKLVYDTIRDNEPISNEGIANILKKWPHEICPRVLELRKLDLVELLLDSKGKPVKGKGSSGRNVSLWKVKHSITQLELIQ